MVTRPFVDKKILSLLQKNATIALADLSKRVGVSKTPSWNRIRKMEEEGIIKVKAYERKPRPGRGDTPGRMKKSYKPFNEYYKKLLADNKLKITEIPKAVTGSLKSQEEIAKLEDKDSTENKNTFS